MLLTHGFILDKCRYCDDDFTTVLCVRVNIVIFRNRIKKKVLYWSRSASVTYTCEGEGRGEKMDATLDYPD